MPAGTSVCCPLTGFHAAELACGQFSSWIEAVIVFAAQAELACWQLTPRVFCGLSHFDESSARAASGFQQWWNMSESEALRAH